MTTLNDGEDVEQLETWYITLESIYFFLKTFLNIYLPYAPAISLQVIYWGEWQHRLSKRLIQSIKNNGIFTHAVEYWLQCRGKHFFP